ncbi:MAG: hypothetical protein J7L89_10320, partial [Bacteroidales bacterium]|nr:hypothetical protein [Bacteroidales bacterium]
MIWGSPSTDVKLPEDPDKRDSVLRAKQAEDSVWSAYLRSHPQIVDSLVHIAAKKLNLKQHAIVLQDSLRCDTLIRQINAIMGQPIIRDSVRSSINGFLFEATWINHGFGCSLRDYIDRTEIVFSMAPAPDRIIGMYDLPRQTITIRKNLVSTAKELISLSLLGVPSKNRSLYMEQLFLLVEHADGRIFFEQLPKETGSGFQPEYQIVELTGDSTPEVIIHAATGGSGGCVNFFIYSLAYEEPVLLLEPQEDGPEISGSFQSGFQAKIILPDESSQTVRLNRQQYDYSMVYQKDGTLVKPVDIWLGCLQDMTVGDVNPNGSHNLVSVYQVKGICNANTIALLKVKWRYSSESWDPVNFTIINNN